MSHEYFISSLFHLLSFLLLISVIFYSMLFSQSLNLFSCFSSVPLSDKEFVPNLWTISCVARIFGSGPARRSDLSLSPQHNVMYKSLSPCLITLHTIKTYWRDGGTAARILSGSMCHLHSLAVLTPRKLPPLPRKRMWSKPVFMSVGGRSLFLRPGI